MKKFDNEIPLIYISGWKGVGRDSATYIWLARHFTNVDCYTPGDNTDVKQMLDELQDIINKNYFDSDLPPILVGNSYGGFLASLMPNTQVLINPALFPSEAIPRIDNLEPEVIDRFKKWELNRNVKLRRNPRRDVYCLCGENDEIVLEHRTEMVSANPPGIIPGASHCLTFKQRDEYLMPILMQLLKPRYQITKISIDDTEKLLSGENCEGYARKLPVIFSRYEDAEQYLAKSIKRCAKGSSTKTVIGYLIQKDYSVNKKWYPRHQWSFAPDGRFLAESSMNYSQKFTGRDPNTLPFRKGDYVIEVFGSNLMLGVIECEPWTPEKVQEYKAKYGDIRMDSSDDCYLVDYIEECHNHPQLACVLPLPFDSSLIPEQVKKDLHWAENNKK